MAENVIGELILKIRTDGKERAKAEIDKAAREAKKAQDKLDKEQSRANAKKAKEELALAKQRQRDATAQLKAVERRERAETKAANAAVKASRERTKAELAQIKATRRAEREAASQAATDARRARQVEATEQRRAAQEQRRQARTDAVNARSVARQASRNATLSVRSERATANERLAEARELRLARSARSSAIDSTFGPVGRPRGLGYNATPQQSPADFGRSFDALGSLDGKLTSMAKGLAALGGSAVVGGLAAAGAAIKSFSEDSKVLLNQAATVGLTTDRLQQFRFVADQTSLGADKLSDAFGEFANNLRESAVAGGKGSAADSLRQLGIDFKEFLKLPLDKQFLAVADAAKEMGPSIGRAAVLSRLFGEESGRKIVSTLELGSEGFERIAAQAQNFGAIIEHDVLLQAAELEKGFGKLHTSTTGVKNAIAVELLPIANELIEKLTAWIRENRALIATKVREWVTTIVDAGKAFAPMLQQWAEHLRTMLPLLKEWSPTLLATQSAIKTITTSREIFKFTSDLTSGFRSAQGAAAGLAGAGGIGAITAALLALLPVAIKVGDALGDIGSQNTGPRATLAQKLIASELTRVGGSGAYVVPGGSAFAAQLAAMSEEDAAKVESEVLAPGRGDLQRRKSLGRIFDQARQMRDEAPVDASDTKALGDAIAQGIGKYSQKELKSLLAQGIITQEQYDIRRGRMNNARAYTARPDGKDPVTDAELLKLINSAVNSGARLDEVLKGRKIAGGTPPVITITQHINNVTAHTQIEVKALPGQSIEQVAQSVSEQFVERTLNKTLARYMPRAGVVT